MMVMTMTYCDDTEVQPCPVCAGDMDIVEKQGRYSIRCHHCNYEYGDFEHKHYMIGAWNALATVFPMSVVRIAQSASGRSDSID